MENQDLYINLLRLCAKIYSPPGRKIECLGIKNNDIDNIITFARKNRLAHYLALEYGEIFKKDAQLSDIYGTLTAEIKEYNHNLKNNLITLKNILGNAQFMVVKTFSAFPHLTSDIDVLVKNKWLVDSANKAISKLAGKNPLTIDINYRFSWTKEDVIRQDFIWNNTQQFDFQGISFLVPNPHLDLLIRIAHMPFELGHVKLGELLHIYKQSLGLDYKILETEAKSAGWPKTFSRMAGVLEKLHHSLFGCAFRMNQKKFAISRNLNFPFPLPVCLLWGAVAEKKAWGKVFGARFIIKERIDEWRQRKIR